MSQDAEWHRRQSEYNRRVSEWMDESRPNPADWKAAVLFYPALHRANYWFDARTERVRATLSGTVGRERTTHVFDDCKDLLYGQAGAIP